jgi:hypothetical protein
MLENWRRTRGTPLSLRRCANAKQAATHGIVHKPTDAAFTPYPDDPYSGITRLDNSAAQIEAGTRAA